MLPTDDPADTLNVEARITNTNQSLLLPLTLNGDQYQAGWMPLDSVPTQLHISLELTDAKNNSLWKCSGDTGDLPVDPISLITQPPSACTPVDTSLVVPLQVINGRTGQSTGIGLPLQWQVASVTKPGGTVVASSVEALDAGTGAYQLTLTPVIAEDIQSHVTANVILNGNPLGTWSYDTNIPISVCPAQPAPTPVPNSCSGQWNYLIWALLVLLLLLLLTRLILHGEKHKEQKRFSFTFWLLIILTLLLVLLWLFFCFDLTLWPLLVLLLILLLFLLRVRFLSGDDDDHKSRRQEWIIVILLVLLLMFWLIFFSGFWVYLVLMLLILLVTLLVIWLLAWRRDEDEPFPVWFLLILLALLVSLWLVFFGNFPGWLALILALIWLAVLLWLWFIDQDRDWKRSWRSWLLILVFVLLVLTWLIYFLTYWLYLAGLLVLLLLIWLGGWALYRYSNPLWGVIGIVDRRNHLLWSASLADPERSGGRSYYHWRFERSIGTVKRVRIHSWNRRKYGLILSVTTTMEGRRTFRRSLEHWKDCELEEGFRIIWLEKLPEPKPHPQPVPQKPRKPAPGGGGRRRKRGYDIIEIEGIGLAYATRLRKLGIHTTDDLLKVAASRKGRQELAAKSGFSTAQLLEWVNRADLMRVPGVGSEYSDLLEAGGVDTVRELRRRNAENLYEALRKVNQKKRLVRRLPELEEVRAWIAAARKMKPIVTY